MYKLSVSRILRVVTAVALTLSLTSCPSMGVAHLVQTDDIRATTEYVVETHDSYLDTVTEVEAVDYRAASAALLALVTDFDELTPGAFSQAAGAIMVRHDTWILADTALMPLDVRVALRNTEVLRRYLVEVSSN
jgi:hypothetical protein